MNLQVSGEAFNLLNRTNFRTVNGVVGNTSIEDLGAALQILRDRDRAF